MPNQFLSDEFGDIEDYFVTDYRLIDNFVGDTLWGWGTNNLVQLGNNSTTSPATPVTTFAGGTTWKQVACNSIATAAIKTDGTLWTWGQSGGDSGGILGNNNGSNISVSTPITTFAGGNDWKQVSVASQAAAIKTDGTLWVWGNGMDGGLGINNLAIFQGSRKLTPVTTFAGGNNWKQVSCGGGITAAIKTDGSLWTWGMNSTGSCGTNDTLVKSTPVTTFAGGNNWKQVSCSVGGHVGAIKTDGSLWTWGLGNWGQLGNNAITNRNTPVTTFAGGNTWKSVYAGDTTTGAIKTDGTLWVWGQGRYIGINDPSSKSTPVTTFSGGNNWKQICLETHTIALKTDGTIWGTRNDFFTFTPSFSGPNNWKTIAVKGSTMLAIKSGLNVDLS
jgi:alpha-tubulin suppressor-like RCC1 family protein